MNDSYLVNIVANDFKHGDTIFEPFLLDASIVGKVATDVSATVNGVLGGVKSAAEGLGGLVNGVKEIVVNGLPNGNGVAVNGH